VAVFLLLLLMMMMVVVVMMRQPLRDITVQCSYSCNVICLVTVGHVISIY